MKNKFDEIELQAARMDGGYWMPFDSIVREFLSAWEVDVTEGAISFKSICEEYPKEVQRRVLGAFMSGKLRAYNPTKKRMVNPLTLIAQTPSSDLYLEGHFRLGIEGRLEYDKVPRGLAKYGHFQFHTGLADIGPFWDFSLNQDFLESTQLPAGKSLTLTVNYKRVGRNILTKSILLHIKRITDQHFILSAEFEGEYYRGVSKDLLIKAKGFISSNGLSVSEDKLHILAEEICFLYESVLRPENGLPQIPSRYSQKHQEVQTELAHFISKLCFKEQDIVNKVGNIFDQEWVAQQTIQPDAEQVDQQVTRTKAGQVPQQEEEFVFKEWGAGGWYIKFKEKVITIERCKGCQFIHAMLELEDGYTPYELDELFDPKPVGAEIPELIDGFKEAHSVPLVYKEKGEMISISQCLALIEAVKKENLQIENQLNELQEYDGSDFTESIELTESFQENTEFIEKLTSKVLGILNETELDSYHDKTRDRIDKNIRDAKAAIAKRDSEAGKYFHLSILKDKTEDVHTKNGRMQFLKKWQHRPKSPIKWVTK